MRWNTKFSRLQISDLTFKIEEHLKLSQHKAFTKISFPLCMIFEKLSKIVNTSWAFCGNRLEIIFGWHKIMEKTKRKTDKHYFKGHTPQNERKQKTFFISANMRIIIWIVCIGTLQNFIEIQIYKILHYYFRLKKIWQKMNHTFNIKNLESLKIIVTKSTKKENKYDIALILLFRIQVMSSCWQ